MDKPPITAEAFARLILRVGTALSARKHSAIQGLSVVEVQLDERVEALAPTPSVSAELVGCQVIVAGPFHPLSVGSEEFRHSLITDRTVSAAVLVVANEVPNGSRLY